MEERLLESARRTFSNSSWRYLPGLISRWMIFKEWRCFTPSRSPRNNSAIYPSRKDFPLAQRYSISSRKVPPATSYILITRQVSVSRKEWKRTTFRCSIPERISASLWKRYLLPPNASLPITYLGWVIPWLRKIFFLADQSIRILWRRSHSLVAWSPLGRVLLAPSINL